MRVATIIYAATGQLDLARQTAAKLRETAAKGTAAQRRASHEADAVLAAADKDFEKAKSELKEAGAAATLGKALVADMLAKAGRKADAQSLKAEVLNTFTATGNDIWARAKVQMI